MVELLTLEALVIAGVVLPLTGSEFDRIFSIAVGILVVLSIHLVLRLTYFNDVLAEVRRLRSERNSTK